MTINADITQAQLTERAADLRREADRERLARAARIARPRRRSRRPARRWWQRLRGLVAPGQRTRAA